MTALTTSVILLCVVGSVYSVRPTRWCVTTTDEEIKCSQLKVELEDILLGTNPPPANTIPESFQCVRTNDVFTCMEMIERDEADLVTLDSGEGYYAGRQHNMMPIMAENYASVSDPARPTYYAVALYKESDPVSYSSLSSAIVCFSGIGMSAGWVHPMARLLEDGIINIVECNSIVKAVSNFFRSMCLPDAINSFHNPYGSNPTTVCEQCKGANEEFCVSSDTYARYDGAFRCVAEGAGQLTFSRHDSVQRMIQLSGTGNLNDTTYRLLCPNGGTSTVDDYMKCNWGEIASNIIMTSAVRFPETVEGYKVFLRYLAQVFGPSGSRYSRFQIFESKEAYLLVDPFNRHLTRKDLMFTDDTIGFTEIGDYTYFSWAGSEFQEYMNKLNRCPSDSIRWCVTSMAEKLKCEKMIMAFKAKGLLPELDCLFGGNTTMCMEMIYRGDADLINLDAADVYIAGRRYGLVPIAAEDYGDTTMEFKVVAAARKTDKSTTLFNMKGKRSCQPGIGRGDGWIIPLNIYIETEQFLPGDCTIFKNIGELFTRSCIPGALDSEYNPSGEPINLCEGCAAGGFRKCQRNGEEQYYGASGAFRCLVEKGGDVAFVRHLTVRDNTDGRNHAIWARNRRSDDYELMCKDGRRLNIDRYDECHLGIVPANAIVISERTVSAKKEIIWSLLNRGQQFFSSDIDGDFHMFDSGIWYSDLVFTDAAVRLVKIPTERQNYKDWLGESFIAQIENLHKYTCVNPDSGVSLRPSLMVFSLVALLSLMFVTL